MTKEDVLTKQVNELQQSIRAFIKAAPSFDNSTELAKDIGRKLANVEITLHESFNCWELGLPK